MPLATLSLQKEAITHLRLPGERMMKLAEELYQEGFVSYPRTETNVFDSAYDLKAWPLRPSALHLAHLYTLPLSCSLGVCGGVLVCPAACTALLLRCTITSPAVFVPKCMHVVKRRQTVPLLVPISAPLATASH